ncbi:tetrathionate reductase alpha subunit precursor [Mesocricetibacter intestinalis]|uniref:Tetrathionate reductase alpha subunit n=1 Tax=Mesocricetibacter intestinalis TaxID=1521930 RepID=A0A4R6V8K3_9PAST|nr:molybdopterin-dependent oxidoreductase [Mesocricetibacter intestinalis]TDQ57961.1 tetrathionate reductase alpha subunit precursor [Mesocricetibacter intestinalis]
MDNKRRRLLKGGLALGGATAFVGGYGPKLKDMAQGAIKGSSGEATADAISANSLLPEYRIADGQLISNPEQVVCHTQCMGCWTLCGVRARVDLKNNRVLRIAGNPYHPLSSDKTLPFDTSIEQAQKLLGGESGWENRSTACARGAAFLEGMNSPYRITRPLKRVGKRGEGKWQTISFEQLIEEVVNGGNLFGEGEVEGLKNIRDIEQLIDPRSPDLGPKSNQLLVTFAGPEGRQPILQRFAQKSFGTINFSSHGSYCGASFRAGSGAFMKDFDNNTHAKPDWDNCEFILFIGTSPAQAGNPFKRQARQLAKKRTEDKFAYAVVSPRLELTGSRATDNHQWIPILPGTDLALVMGMLGWIIEQELFNRDYLSRPTMAAAKSAHHASYSNATHLFIIEADHPKYGQALRISDLTGESKDSAETRDKSAEQDIIVKDLLSGRLLSAKESAQAELFVHQRVMLADGSEVQVASAMSLLRQSCEEKTLAQYSAICGVGVEQIKALAERFTAQGSKAVAITHGGTMHSTGFYTSWAILLLNAMVGNMNKKGGMCVNAGKFKDFGKGPRYDLSDFNGMLKPKGTNLARSKRAYENSSEYKRKAAAGENPYPAKAAWYPFTGGQMTEMLTSMLQGYPYPVKAWISHMSNPLYGMTGLNPMGEEKLKDPKILPLFIAVDAFMNETSALADYIVPDTHNFESWGFSTPWGGVPTRASTARWPLVESPNAKSAEGHTLNMENFIIALAKAMNLPGFGADAIRDSEGNSYSLDCAEDFFLRAAANIAYAGEKPVADANPRDLLLTGAARLIPQLERTLKAEEVGKAAHIYCKGGRFAPYSSAWKEEDMAFQWKNCLQIWSESVAKARHHSNGEHYPGCPHYMPPRFADGSELEQHYPSQDWGFKLVSFKSNIMSSITAPLLRLHSIKPEGMVAMHREDGEKLGIKHGEQVKIITPSGSKTASVMLIEGIAQGVIAIEHGYGHKQLGAQTYVIDGQEIKGHEMIKKGINLNDLALIDHTKQVPSAWQDWVCGSAVRNGIPARVEKIG